MRNHLRFAAHVVIALQLVLFLSTGFAGAANRVRPLT